MARRLKSAGRGTVTIDSGAAESVISRGMLEGEPLVEGEAKIVGVKYVAADGANVDNNGKKRIRFRKEGLSGISDMLFQVTDVLHREQQQRPEDPADGGEGTFVMVEYLEPDPDSEGFTRQGN